MTLFRVGMVQNLLETGTVLVKLTSVFFFLFVFVVVFLLKRFQTLSTNRKKNDRAFPVYTIGLNKTPHYTSVFILLKTD